MFSYGPHRQRYKQVATFAGPSTLTTWYVGGILEKVVATSTTHYKHFIQGPKGLVASYNRRSNGTTETLYYTHDHLGSVDSITTTAGAVSARLSYDLWGKRRNESGWTGALPGADWTAIGNSVRKGFTEHEHLDNIGLIHMNGRVYDPIIGRFMSADPFIPNPMSTQSFNRYSYMQNNPLSGTDPSGFCEVGGPVCNWINEHRPWMDMTAWGLGGANPTPPVGTEFMINDRRIDVPPSLGEPGTTNPDPGSPPTPPGPIDETPTITATSCDGSILPCNSIGPSIAEAADAAAGWVIPGWETGKRADQAWSDGQYGSWAGLIALGTGEMLLAVVTMGESAAALGASRAAARGTSSLGGIIASTTNSAGGTVVTTTGRVVGSDFAGAVNSGMLRGGPVNILSGAHGEASGLMRAERAFFEADRAAFGGLEGVNVFDITRMAPGEISGLVRGPGTTIGAFCDSGACLAPFR